MGTGYFSGTVRAIGGARVSVASGLLLAALVALLVMAGPAISGTNDLTVTKTADTNDGTCSFNDCSLREAIIAANATSVDSIFVPAGTYKLTITGTDEDNAATGDLDIRRGMSIVGLDGARKTVIDGNGIDRVFHLPVNPPNPFTASISGVKITGGDVSGPGGGIFHDAQGVTLFLTQSTVSGNKSSSGGGIMTQRGPLNIIGSTISGNQAPDGLGGGIEDGGGVLTLKNTTVSGNKSKFGGGIITYDTLNITDSTIAFNTAQQPGGGIFINSGTVTAKNAIVSNNTSNFAGFNNCSRDNVIVSQGNNLEKGTSCGFNEASDINAGPRLGNLANNGGPTNTHALLAGSPAIDAGGTPFPSSDQRNVYRPQGTANDIGAYEKKAINIVQCPTGPGTYDCIGTDAPDELIGRNDDFDYIQGGGGDDTYNGKGSCDSLYDSSITNNDHFASNDLYLVTVKNFCNVGISSLSVRDAGGTSDTLDLSRFYKSTDFTFSIGYENLHMDGPGVNDVDVNDFYSQPGPIPMDSIDFFKFSDKTLTAQQVRDMIS